MLCKQGGELNQSRTFDQWIVSRFHSRTNHRIEHPRRHAAGGAVGKPHVNHIPTAASRSNGFEIFPEERMIRIEDFRKQTDTRIVERVS